MAVKFLLSLLHKANKIFLCSDIKLDVDPLLQTRRLGYTQDLFLSAREIDWLLYFPFGKSTHNNTFEEIPLLFRDIGHREFANPVVEHLTSPTSET
jgi:hypothetical protein